MPRASAASCQLEKSLGGISLFDRSSLPLTLTDDGRFALDYATKMITLHDQLVTGLAANTNAMSGLRVGVPPALPCQGFLMPFFVSFGRGTREVPAGGERVSRRDPDRFLVPRWVARRCDVVRPRPHALNFVQIRYGDAGSSAARRPLTSPATGCRRRLRNPRITWESGFKSPLRLGTVGQQLTRGSERRAVRFKRDIVFSSALSREVRDADRCRHRSGSRDLHCYRELAKRGTRPRAPRLELSPAGLLHLHAPRLMKLKRVRTFIDEYRADVEPLLAECAK